MRPILVLIAAYLLGSIPFGYLIVRFKERADVRETGSGGTGATNVSRSAGKLAGVLTLVLDAAKGSWAILLAQSMLQRDVWFDWWIAATAVVVIVGHCFPVWLKFRGGKGVATGVGVFISLAPLALVLAGVVFVKVVRDTHFVSLASIMASVTLPLFIWLLSFIKPTPNLLPLVVTSIMCSTLIIFMHHENIQRLLEGTENKFK